MTLFGKLKKSESSENNGNTETVQTGNGAASVKVLGSGCAKCNALEKAVREALAELGMDTQVEHVTDFAQIAAFGVMSTPALVVDGKVVSFGRVLTKDAVITILKKVRG
jgi:small redox-active disulfide protein 2